ncbi:MAG: hypothetical protein MUP36_01820, partial [Demequinaceae bacterium]|nr:hypothetical protein [Demequinaceae bacterium]
GTHAENVALAIRETLGLAVSVVGIDGQEPIGSASATPTSEPVSAPETPEDPSPPAPVDETPEPDDAPAPDAELSGPEVIARMLGGTVIDD